MNIAGNPCRIRAEFLLSLNEKNKHPNTRRDQIIMGLILFVIFTLIYLMDKLFGFGWFLEN
tara:strand:- start:22412 stop:22594 length:183 start_codon:yes stop_codon:yes gene_type:complete